MQLSARVDAVLRPQVRVLHRPRSTFQIMGYLGLAVAVLLALTLVWAKSLDLWLMLALIALAVGAFFALAVLSRLLFGEERLVYFYHQTAVLLVGVIALTLLRQPRLVYLDILLLGVGAFTAFGRVGCLMAGCCYGRPHDWGVCYHAEHTSTGFPRALVGVRLLPVQAFESAWLFLIVAVGAALVLTGSQPGLALVWFLFAYAAGRFSLECLRGDAARPYWRGMSEAQWFALAYMALAAAMAIFLFAPPLRLLGVVLAAVMAILLTVWLLRRAGRSTYQHPYRIRELAEILSQLPEDVNSVAATTAARDQPQVEVFRTSFGLRISAGSVVEDGVLTTHYALSNPEHPLGEDEARELGRLIRRLRHPAGAARVIVGHAGVYHVFIPSR